MRLCFDLEEPAVVVLVSQEEELQSIAHEGRGEVEEVETGFCTEIDWQAWMGIEARSTCKEEIPL